MDSYNFRDHNKLSRSKIWEIDRRGIKHGLNGFLIGYELGQVELWFLAGRVGSVRHRAELGRQPRRA
jgi:hypothetical protein